VGEHGALNWHEMRERVADLEADREALRVTLHEAVRALHVIRGERDRLRRRVSQLLEHQREAACPAVRGLAA
jgi:regulator of replication initiation timing